MTPTHTLIAGLILLALIVPLALKRVAFLVKWITDGQPAPDRWDNTVEHPIAAGNKHNVEVLGQAKLLRWTLPGIAHAFVMYAFFILLTVYIEAFETITGQRFEPPPEDGTVLDRIRRALARYLAG